MRAVGPRQEKVFSAFEQMDTNNDGLVTKEEFYAYFGVVSSLMSPEEFANTVGEMRDVAGAERGVGDMLAAAAHWRVGWYGDTGAVAGHTRSGRTGWRQDGGDSSGRTLLVDVTTAQSRYPATPAHHQIALLNGSLLSFLYHVFKRLIGKFRKKVQIQFSQEFSVAK